MQFASLVVSIFLGLSLHPSASLAATDATSCAGKNSCWALENRSDFQVSVQCVDDHGYFKGKTWTIDSQKDLPIQFGTSWGDGLGFPEAGVQIQCVLRRHDGKALSAGITSLDWGDFVQWTMTNHSVVVTQMSTWNTQLSSQRRYSW